MHEPEHPSPCFVYILGCDTRSGYRTYVGWTLDLERRLAQHNSGKGAKSTRGALWTLLYYEQYDSRRAAMSREWHLKRDRAFRKKLRDDAMAGDGRQHEDPKTGRPSPGSKG